MLTILSFDILLDITITVTFVLSFDYAGHIIILVRDKVTRSSWGFVYFSSIFRTNNRGNVTWSGNFFRVSGFEMYYSVLRMTIFHQFKFTHTWTIWSTIWPKDILADVIIEWSIKRRKCSEYTCRQTRVRAWANKACGSLCRKNATNEISQNRHMSSYDKSSKFVNLFRFISRAWTMYEKINVADMSYRPDDRITYKSILISKKLVRICKLFVCERKKNFERFDRDLSIFEVED